MLIRINRLIVAVRDLDVACEAFARALGLTRGERSAVPDVGAVTEALPAGDAWVQILQPVDEGPVAQFIDRHDAGIYGIGLLVRSLADTRLRVEQCGRQAHPLRLGGNELVCLKREQLPGMTVWLTEEGSGPNPADCGGLIEGVGQATNLVLDRDEAVATYQGLFGPPVREREVRSDEYGFLSRTLFYGASEKTHSIEIAQVLRQDTAMGRFWQRHGPSVYMATLNVHDLRPLRDGLERRGVRHSSSVEQGTDILYIHPSELAGCFAAVTATP